MNIQPRCVAQEVARGKDEPPYPSQGLHHSKQNMRYSTCDGQICKQQKQKPIEASCFFLLTLLTKLILGKADKKSRGGMGGGRGSGGSLRSSSESQKSILKLVELTLVGGWCPLPLYLYSSPLELACALLGWRGTGQSDRKLRVCSLLLHFKYTEADHLPIGWLWLVKQQLAKLARLRACVVVRVRASDDFYSSFYCFDDPLDDATSPFFEGRFSFLFLLPTRGTTVVARSSLGVLKEASLALASE